MIMFLELSYIEMAPSGIKRSEVEIELVFWLLLVNTNIGPTSGGILGNF
jgi:hypothetical protein